MIGLHVSVCTLFYGLCHFDSLIIDIRMLLDANLYITHSWCLQVSRQSLLLFFSRGAVISASEALI